MSTIEQIKAEIEGWLKEYAEDSQFELGERYGYKRLLSFLDTLESEKSMNPEELEKEAINYCFDNGLNLSPRVATDFARHFAQCGAEHLADARKTSQSDLKDASEKEYPCDKSWMTDSMLDMNAHCQVAFWKGAKWMADHTPLPEDTVLFNKGVAEGKRLMMEEAVDGRVISNDGISFPVSNEIHRLKLIEGDKVRIIIVKENEK